MCCVPDTLVRVCRKHAHIFCLGLRHREVV